MKKTEYHICDDGTIIEKKDYIWLKKHMKKVKKPNKNGTTTPKIATIRDGTPTFKRSFKSVSRPISNNNIATPTSANK